MAAVTLRKLRRLPETEDLGPFVLPDLQEYRVPDTSLHQKGVAYEVFHQTSEEQEEQEEGKVWSGGHDAWSADGSTLVYW